MLEKQNSRIPMFGKVKIENAKYWKLPNSEFQCLKK